MIPINCVSVSISHNSFPFLLPISLPDYGKENSIPEKKKTQNGSSVTKVPTGLAGFDEIAHGGLPKGRTTLVAGTSGSGKTVFAMQFLMGGIKEGENGVFITFEETPRRY